MRTIRIYQNISLTVKQTVGLDERATHYLRNVLRVKLGQKISIFNGLGGEFLGEIIKIGKKNMQIILQEFFDINRESSLDIHLMQGISKGDHMNFAIQKAVELGVKTITPVISEYCDIKQHVGWEKRIMHWNNIIVGASEQCGRNILPTLNLPMKFLDAISSIDDSFKLLFDGRSETGLFEYESQSKTISILIGPEGGFSEDEIKLAKVHGFNSVKLGNRILRTETAAITAVSACQTLWGDFFS